MQACRGADNEECVAKPAEVASLQHSMQQLVLCQLFACMGLTSKHCCIATAAVLLCPAVTSPGGHR